ncbi:MAG: BPTI/Kunitz-type proteinase inhibitor domain-containing protein [Bacteroidota bacterium]|nr:BPTI/Kunitz-type proteinase inhibitor domain-containing protein [Bacteroidota bacterium]
MCSHKPPTDELCAAYFERWFYNSEENSCEQIGYSRCNQWGFESLEGCQDCDYDGD